MAQNEKRRQKALMKKKRKDKERKKSLSHSTGSDSFSNKIKLVKNARNFSIFECMINNDWRDKGLATILLPRKQPNNELIIGRFLA